MLSTKIAHSLRAVEVVDHQEAAAQQVLAQLRGLRVGQVPLTDFDGIEPRPIEDVVAVVEVDGLLDRAGVDDAQAGGPAPRCGGRRADSRWSSSCRRTATGRPSRATDT